MATEHTTVESPGARLLELASAGEPAALEAVLALYDALPAVAADEMIGDWDGEAVPTGHPGERALGKLRWVGKTFRGRDDVDPMICLDENGDRQASPVMGSATLRQVEYRGVTTATMVYDNHPVFDHFRRADDDAVVGAMDRKGEDAPLVFVLRRRP